ncbi:MAG: 6-bladed beta-propeller [Tenuifilaceae bacterium]|nr:6-bladed beta-propeller [Tenuifilaceae bacterium]
MRAIKKHFFLKITSLVIGLLISFSACHNKQTPLETKHPIITIDIENNLLNFKILKLSTLNASVRYIPLQTNDETTLQSILNLDLNDSLLIVNDFYKLLLFNLNGVFISEIAKKGRGPHEHLSIASPRLNNREIYVPDYIRNRMKIYNTYGEELYQVNFPERSLYNMARLKNWIQFTDTSYLVSKININGQEKYRVMEVGINGKLLRGFENTTFFKLYKNNANDHYAYGSVNMTYHMYKFQENYRLFHKLSDTVWQIDNSRIYPAYILNRGKHGLNHQLFGIQRTSKEFRDAFNRSVEVETFLETNSLIFFQVQYRKQYPFDFIREVQTPFGPTKVKYDILGVYNKTTKEFFFVAPSGVDHQLEPLGIENDIDGGINFTPMYSPNERTLVSWFNAYDLKAHVASEEFRGSTPKYPERKRELEALANRLKIDDNPVLMVVTFKE